MTLDKVIETLSEYLKTRDRAYHNRKWIIADEAMQYFGQVDFDTWALLYNGTISLL